jgi:hypothetical protein
MQIPIAIEQLSDGRFRAKSFTVAFEGNTREEALAKVRNELNLLIQQGKVVMVEVGTREKNPWQEMAGWLKDDPLYDEWQEAIREFRRERDIEEGIVIDRK